MSVINAGSKNSKSIVQRNKKKHDKIVLLEKAKLDKIELLIYKALIDSNICRDEFASVNNMLK